MSDPIKVKRDGPRGWHNIAAASFDPEIHELFEDETSQDAPIDTPLSIEIGTGSGEQFSNEQLRAAIKNQTGESPAGRTSRETLIKQFNELNKRFNELNASAE